MGDMIDVVVSGHLCLDLIPGMSQVTADDLTVPGRLYFIDPIQVATGGAVSNTGLALHRLGTTVKLMAAVGNDLIGQMILTCLRQRDPQLAAFVRVKNGQPSSSTIALSPRNADRTFLHCAGTNDSFGVGDIDFELVRSARIFHLGYPTLLPHLVQADGEELVSIYKSAKAVGAVTSLDMAQPDPNSAIAKLNWLTIFKRVLPYVDIFIPSIEEIVLTLRPDEYKRWSPNVLHHIDRSYLRTLADQFLAMGVAVAGFKLGELGIYLRTGGPPAVKRLASLPIDMRTWVNTEHWHPAFNVDVAGTTGAGDSAYAGFLTAVLQGFAPYEALRWACAVGACNVEAADATSGIKTWAQTQARLDLGWTHRNEVLREG